MSESEALRTDMQAVADSHLAGLLWDVLWFGLAITTAWKMMKREPAAPEVKPEPA